MSKAWLLGSIIIVSSVSVDSLESQIKPEERQIQEAISPLSEDLQEGAAVLGYRGGKLVELRAGTNEMICLADDPDREGFHVACYHRDLESFMARGRELRADGMSRDEVTRIRREEIEEGKLEMPNGARSLYSLTGPEGSFDPESGTITEGGGLWVIYVPYATTETLGISSAPSRARPWLMFPGKPWAHVMIGRRVN